MSLKGIVALFVLGVGNIPLTMAMRLAFDPPFYWLLWGVWTIAATLAIHRAVYVIQKQKDNRNEPISID